MRCRPRCITGARASASITLNHYDRPFTKSERAMQVRLYDYKVTLRGVFFLTEASQERRTLLSRSCRSRSGPNTCAADWDTHDSESNFVEQSKTALCCISRSYRSRAGRRTCATTLKRATRPAKRRKRPKKTKLPIPNRPKLTRPRKNRERPGRRKRKRRRRRGPRRTRASRSAYRRCSETTTGTRSTCGRKWRFWPHWWTTRCRRRSSGAGRRLSIIIVPFRVASLPPVCTSQPIQVFFLIVDFFFPNCSGFVDDGLMESTLSCDFTWRMCLIQRQ